MSTNAQILQLHFYRLTALGEVPTVLMLLEKITFHFLDKQIFNCGLSSMGHITYSRIPYKVPPVWYSEEQKGEYPIAYMHKIGHFTSISGKELETITEEQVASMNNHDLFKDVAALVGCDRTRIINDNCTRTSCYLSFGDAMLSSGWCCGKFYEERIFLTSPPIPGRRVNIKPPANDYQVVCTAHSSTVYNSATDDIREYTLFYPGLGWVISDTDRCSNYAEGDGQSMALPYDHTGGSAYESTNRRLMRAQQVRITSPFGWWCVSKKLGTVTRDQLKNDNSFNWCDMFVLATNNEGLRPKKMKRGYPTTKTMRNLFDSWGPI